MCLINLNKCTDQENFKKEKIVLNVIICFACINEKKEKKRNEKK